MKLRPLLVFVLAITMGTLGTAGAQETQSPEEFLGHPVGADYTLVHWLRIVEYFEHLGETSDRVNVRNLGETTEGNPFLFVEISDSETIANLAPHKDNQRKLADPRLVSSVEEENRLVHETKVPVVVNCQLHSSETAASQMSMELAYELATSDTPEIAEILDGTIVLLIPCANPDGQILVKEWYDRSLGEPWEGGGMPWLYQKYAGHDNNRDWFALNLKETRLTTEVLYKEWFPTIVWDVHQMGSTGARLFVPPFHDPKNYNVHPVIDQTLLVIGGHMSSALARRDMRGVVHGAMYDNWWAGGFRTTPYRHNMVGILTEMASVNGASPIFLRKDELTGSRRGMPDHEMRTNFPDPWPGGWWRLRDIIDYELIIAKSLFTYAARYHDELQGNYLHFGREAIETGEEEPPFAWLVPPDQWDDRRAYELLERLSATAIEVHRADEAFTADGVDYPEGTFIMYCAQPYRPHLMDMMERQVYPDRELYPGGPAESPYDMAGWTFPLQMGVRHVAVTNPFQVADTKLEEIPFPQGEIRDGQGRYLAVNAGSNDDYRLLNRLFEAGIDVQVFRPIPVTENQAPYTWTLGDTKMRPGSFAFENSADARELLDGVASDCLPTNALAERGMTPLRKPRAALYQPWVASMDEGWTRLALEHYEVAYTTIHNAEIQSGNLIDRYDAIVFPSIYARYILEGRSPDTTAPEYVGGIGETGVVALQDFVQAGGTLVCIDNSANMPIDHFNIPVYNIVEGKSSEEFFCPGSVLRLSMDTAHPVGWGMPEWYSGYFARSQAFGLGEKPEKDDAQPKKSDDPRAPENRFKTEVVSRFSDTVLLESGWIRGGDIIADQPAIVDVSYGGGHVVLIGIGVQRRGQPHGTYRILFNAMQMSVLGR